MEIDAAQYAALSMEMIQTGNYFEIFLRGENYLDKPPLTFWLSALSFKIFGINEIAYRIPNFLFTLLAFFSTYRLAKLFYSKEIAWLSVLILGSSQAYFLMNHDCRTDTILTGAVIFSIWQLAAYLRSKKWIFIFGTGFGIGLSLLTKGPMGLVIPILAFGPHLLLQRNFKSIFDWKWIIVLIIASLMLIPMSMGLYKQYGIYGLRFYYWIQSFGRITGESSWDNGTGYFFLLQNHLWSFAPFILFFFPAIYVCLKTLLLQRLKIHNNQEIITLSGFVLPFMAFSTSHYQLPHYIFVLYPLAAILTSKYIIENFPNLKFRLTLIIPQYILLAGFLALIVYLTCFCFKVPIPLFLGYTVILVGIILGSIKSFTKTNFIIYFSILFYAWINFGLNGWVYPNLLKYQVGSEIALYAQKNSIPSDKIICYKTDGGFALDFYLNKIIPKNTDSNFPNLENLDGKYLVTNQEGLQIIGNAGYKPKIVFEGDDYHVTTLTPKFLNPSTRSETTEKKYLVLVKK